MAAKFPSYPDSGAQPPPPPKVSLNNPLRTTGPVARWVTAGSTLVLTGGLAAYLYLVDPNNPASAYPQCPLKALTGLDCPGCGGLRATHAMVHGDIMGALDHSVLAVIIVPMLAYIIFRWVVGQFGKELPKIPSRPYMSWAIPLAVLVFTIVRNIPFGPFYYLNSATST